MGEEGEGGRSSSSDHHCHDGRSDSSRSIAWQVACGRWWEGELEPGAFCAESTSSSRTSNMIMALVLA